MLKIWGRRNSLNVQKAMWAIGETGVAHEHINAGGSYGGLDTPEFRAMNPNMRVPVIDDGGTVLWESHAIVRYIAARYGKGRLWNEDAGLRSRADQWIDWTLASLQPAFIAVFWGQWRTPEPQRNLPAVAQNLARTNTLFQLLDRHLAGRKFVAGDDFTMGDIPPGAQLYRYFEMPIERPTLPSVEAWYARLKDRPAYREHVMIPFEDLRGRTAF